MLKWLKSLNLDPFEWGLIVLIISIFAWSFLAPKIGHAQLFNVAANSK